ncbi:carbonic anhydrase [Penicillium capsulatum]|uniref:Carbonic anhydrase n=1 Tax=Penicillium capsulatum TaxID=69766 RepID=A0A9W9I2I8_9EURO|nr:carbonic anhydrase [Penicillium capsulatum]KAJ6117464.1 carbonic anhydrase [Penicillium capsulatum]
MPHQETTPRDLRNYTVRTVGSEYIPSLKQPEKQILWVGCCDSSFKETGVFSLLPDELLEHRNLGNMILDGDLSCETSVKHAVIDLQVKHIVVCGHYGCGIVRTGSGQGLAEPWLSKLEALRATQSPSVDQLSPTQRDRSYVELNVLEQLRSLRKYPEVAGAIKRGKLQIHGIVYDSASEKAHLVSEEAM